MVQLILVADDEATLTQLLEEYLQEVGYKTLSANNGQEAFRLLSQHKVNLIISDVMMPVLDGYGLVRRVRETSEFMSIPVLLISAAPLDKAKLLPNKVEAFLSKPYDLNQVEQVVQALTK